MNKVANFLRLFFGLFFLAGAALNTYLGITNLDGYKNGGVTAWPPFLQNFWVDVVAPNIAIFLVLFILIEIVLGLLLLNKGRWVKIGLIGSIFFGIGLLFLGLGYPQDDWVPRIPNMVIVVVWALLLLGRYDKTLLETIRRK